MKITDVKARGLSLIIFGENENPQSEAFNLSIEDSTYQGAFLEEHIEVSLPLQYMFRDNHQKKITVKSSESLNLDWGQSYQFVSTLLGILKIEIGETGVSIEPFVIDKLSLGIDNNQIKWTLERFNDEKAVLNLTYKDSLETKFFIIQSVGNKKFPVDFRMQRKGELLQFFFTEDVITDPVNDYTLVINQTYQNETILLKKNSDKILYDSVAFKIPSSSYMKDELVLELPEFVQNNDLYGMSSANIKRLKKTDDKHVTVKLQDFIEMNQKVDTLKLVAGNRDTIISGDIILEDSTDLSSTRKISADASSLKIYQPLFFNKDKELKKLKTAKKVKVVANINCEKDLSISFNKPYQEAILLLKERKKNNVIEVIGKHTTPTDYSFDYQKRLLAEADVLSNKRWDAFVVVSDGDSKSIYKLANQDKLYKNKPDRYFPIVSDKELVSVYDRKFQLYWTVDNELALVKNTVSNLFRERNNLKTNVLSINKSKKDLFLLEIKLSSKFMNKIKTNKIFFVQRNKDEFNAVELLTSEVKRQKDDAIIQCSIDFNTLEIQPLYWDIYIELSDDIGKDLVRVSGVSKQVKQMVQKNILKNQVIIEEFISYPYVTLGGDLSWQYRLKEVFENPKNYFKENLAFYIAKILHPYYKNKNIWIGFEKVAQSAHDSGYHFFDYCYNNTNEKNYYYVIDKDSPERKFLMDKKDRVIDYMSFKYFVYLYSAKLLISSDTKRNVYNLKQKETKMGRALTDKKLVYLQHGVNGLKTVRDFYKDRGVFDLVIAPSEFEKELIVKEWGYSENEVFATGLARWDVMADRSNLIPFKQIFVMPTWRTWMDGMTDEDFLASNYYQEYQAFLSNPSLKKLCLDNNMRIAFFLHPKFKNYIHLFSLDSEYIDKYDFLEVPLDDMIMKSSLMVSDYSSIIWEMFYLKKPCVFYHFDCDDYLKYEGMYLDPEKDLFGDRAFDSEKLIEIIKKYFYNDFKEEEKYGNMRNTYFNYTDQLNSKRIYSVIKENEESLFPENKITFKIKIRRKLGKVKRRIIRELKK